MYSLSAKFRPSRRADTDGSVYYTISVNCKERSVTSSIKSKTKDALQSERRKIAQDLRIIYCVIEDLVRSGKEYTMDDLVAKSAAALGMDSAIRLKVLSLGDRISVDRSIVRIDKKYVNIDDSYNTNVNADVLLTDYVYALSKDYCEHGRRIGKSLGSLCNNISRYLKGRPVKLKDIDETFIAEYHKFVSASVAPSTLAFYMSTMRTVVNNANKAGFLNLSMDWSAYIRINNLPKTRVVATLGREALQQIIALDLADEPYIELVRDTFIFSFYTRGMEYTDICSLKKENLNGNLLSYHRRKSGREVKLPVGDKVMEIIKRHTEEDSEYLLPLLYRGGKSIAYATAKSISYRALRIIGERLVPKQKLSFSMTRVSWEAMMENINVAEAIV